MESSISSLTYKGSITEAIAAARSQKKLFLVYISGNDTHSVDLEQSTWSNLNVSDAISKKCIFLHLVNGTPDASNFSAIFPQKSLPSISIVGSQGLMLWNHGGYLSADALVESINNAWASLQLQETAAALLTAALASKNHEPSSSCPIDVASSGIESSTSPDIPIFSTDNGCQGSDDNLVDAMPQHLDNQTEDLVSQHLEDQRVDLVPQLSDDRILSGDLLNSLSCESEAEIKEVKRDPSSSTCLPVDVDARERRCYNQQLEVKTPNAVIAEGLDHEMDVIEVAEGSSKSDGSNDIRIDEYSQSSSIIGKHKDVMSTVATSSSSHFKSSSAEENSSSCMTGALAKEDEGKMAASSIKPEQVTDKVDKRSQEMLTDVLLNIRLPNGSCLQKTFCYTDTLGLVREYVSKNGSNCVGSFDLAVPYPKRIFSEREMDESLSQLGFAHREALIVIPYRLASRIKHNQPLSSITTSDDHGNNIGYFGYLKRVLSYFNPFSYIGGNGNSSYSEPGENHNLQHNASSYSPYTPDRQTPSSTSNAADKQRPTNSQSNVRTLRDFEEEDLNGDRNLFWNGNSTQFGGDDKK